MPKWVGLYAVGYGRSGRLDVIDGCVEGSLGAWIGQIHLERAASGQPCTCPGLVYPHARVSQV